MNVELQWKLQAWVDGELPETERNQVVAIVERDAEARALVTELKMTRGFLTGNETEARLPESGDFFWSKIRREIERQDKIGTPARPTQPWLLAWRRFLAPASGVALVAFLSVLSLNVLHHPANDATQQLVETENLSEHVGSISYKSQAENMFVVYLYDKDQEPVAEAELEVTDNDVLLQ